MWVGRVLISAVSLLIEFCVQLTPKALGLQGLKQPQDHWASEVIDILAERLWQDRVEWELDQAEKPSRK